MTRSVSALLDLAKEMQQEVCAMGAGPPVGRDEIEQQFDKLVTDRHLRESTRGLFADGYYANAVEEAFKCVNNMVKTRSGVAKDGADLMRNVFSVKSPLLKLNALSSESEYNQQQGYMDIFAGCMTGIRNPRAHEHSYLDEPHVALEMLAWANHLIRMVNAAKRIRNRKPGATTPTSTP